MIEAARLSVAVDTSDVDKAKSSIASLGSTVGKIASSPVKALSGLAGFVKDAGLAVFGAGQLLGAVEGVTNGLFGFNAMMEQSTVAFTGLLGSGEAASKMLSDLQQFAAATPFEFPELVTASQRLIGVGIAAQNVIPWMTAIGDAVAGMGGGSEAVGRVTTAITQMSAKGKITAEEMMQLTEANIPGWQLLAKATGKTTAELMDMSSQGLLPATEYLPLLIKGMEETFGGQMANQALTFNGLMSTLKDNIRLALGAFTGPLFVQAKRGLDQLGQLVSSQAFQDFAKNMGERVGRVIERLVGSVRNVIHIFEDLVSEHGVLNIVATKIALALGVPRGSKQLIGFVATVRSGFGILRDGVITFIQALRGNWVQASGILPFHQAIGRLALLIRATLVPAWVFARDAVLTFAQALRGDWTDAEGIRPLHRAIGLFGTLLRTVVIPAVGEFADWLRGTALPAARDLFGYVQSVAVPLIETFAGRLRALGTSILTAFQPFVDLAHSADFQSFFATTLLFARELIRVMSQSRFGLVSQLQWLAENVLPPLVRWLALGVGWFIDLGASASDNEPKVQRLARAVGTLLQAWLALQTARKVVTLTQRIVHTGQALITKLNDIHNTITQRVERVGRVITRIRDVSGRIIQRISTVFATAQDALIWAQLYAEQGINRGRTITQKIATSFASTADKAVWEAVYAQLAAKQLAVTIQQKLVTIGSDIWSKVTDGAQKTVTITAKVVEPTQGLGNVATNIGTKMATGIAQGIGVAIGGALAVAIGTIGLAGLATAGLVLAGALAVALVVAFPQQTGYLVGATAAWLLNVVALAVAGLAKAAVIIAPAIVALFTSAFQLVGAAVGGLATLIGGVLSDAVRLALDIATAVFVQWPAQIVASLAQNLGPGVATFIQGVMSGDWGLAIGGALDALKGLFIGWPTDIATIITTGFQTDILGRFDQFFSDVGERFNTFFSDVGAAWGGFTDTVAAAASGVIDGIKSVFDPAIDWVKGWVSDFASGVTRGFSSQLNDRVKDILSELPGAVSSAFSSMRDQAVGLVEETASGVVSTLSGLVSDASGAAANIVSGIVSAITSLPSDVGTTFTEMQTTITTTLASIVSEMPGKGLAIIAGLIQGIANGMSGLAAMVSGIATSILSAFAGASGWLVGAGADIIRGLIGGIESMAGAAADAAVNVVKGAVDKAKGYLGISSPSKVFMGIGNFAMQGFTIGIEDGAPDAVKAAADAANAVIGAFDALIDFGAKAANGITLPSQDITNRLRDAVQMMISAVSDVAGSFSSDGLKAAQEYASTGKTVVDLLASVSTAFKDTVVVPTFDQIAELKFAVEHAVQSIADSAAMFTGDALASAKVYSDAAGSVVGLLGAAAEAFQTTVIVPTFEQISDLKFAIEHAVRSIADSAAMFSDDALKAAQDYSGAGKAVVDLLGSVVKAFSREVVVPSFEQIAALKFAVEHAVRSIVDSAAMFTEKGLAAAQTYAAAAKSVVGVISNAVDAFNVLRRFDPSANVDAAMVAVASFGGEVIDRLQLYAGQFTTSVYSAATTYAKAIQDSIGWILGAIDAFKALARFDGSAFVDDALLNLSSFGGEVIDRLEMYSEQFTTDVYDAATLYAKTIQDAVGWVTDAIGAFKALADFDTDPIVEPALDRLVMFANEVTLGLADQTRWFTQSVQDAASIYNETVGNAVGWVTDAISAFAALATMDTEPIVEPALDRLTMFANEVALGLESQVPWFTETVQGAALTYKTTVQNAVGWITDAVDAFQALATMNPAAFVEPAFEKLVMFANVVTLSLKDQAQFFTKDVQKAAETYGKTVEKAVGWVSDAVDAFTALGKMNLSKHIEKPLDDLIGVTLLAVQKLDAAAANLQGIGWERAQAFAETAGAILGLLSSATDFSGMKNYGKNMMSGIDAFFADVKVAVQKLIALGDELGTGLIEAQAIAQQVQSIVDLLTPQQQAAPSSASHSSGGSSSGGGAGRTGPAKGGGYYLDGVLYRSFDAAMQAANIYTGEPRGNGAPNTTGQPVVNVNVTLDSIPIAAAVNARNARAVGRSLVRR